MSHHRRAALLSGTAAWLSGVAACTLGLFCAPGVAWAVDATPAEAASLEAAVRDSVGGLLGPSIKLGDRPVRMVAAGDHYDVSILLAKAGTRTAADGPPLPQDIAITGAARPGDHGSWIIEGVKLTNPVTYTLDMPVPPQDTPAPSGRSPTPRGPKVVPGKPSGAAPTLAPMTYVIDQRDQVGRILWDPTFKTASTWTTSLSSLTAKVTSASIQTDMSTGAISAVSTLRPVGTDRVDISNEGTLQDYRISAVGDAGPVEVAMKSGRVSIALNGVSRARGVQLMQAMAGILGPMMDGARGGGREQAAARLPDLLRAIIVSLDDFASDFSLDEGFDGLIAKASGQTVAMTRVRLGLDARTDAGLLLAGMNLGFEGLTLPDLDLGAMGALVPTRVALRPVLGGIAVADVMRFARLASENKDPDPADLTALFSHGGITSGFESLVVELAGATVTGQGKVVATGPSADAISGSATLTAENFDGAMQRVQAIPGISGQALPVMLFLKGVGRTVDNKLVWDVSYKDGKLLINNVDLTALAGAGGGAPVPPPAAPPAPRLPQGSPGGALKSAPRPGALPSWAR